MLPIKTVEIQLCINSAITTEEASNLISDTERQLRKPLFLGQEMDLPFVR